MIDELILREPSGRRSEAEQSRLTDWRRASPENERHYQQMRSLLAATQTAVERMPIPPPPPIASMMRKPAPAAVPRQGAVLAIGAGLWWGLGVAAAATLAAVFIITRAPLVPNAARGPQALEFVSNRNSARTVRLEDGSVVRLAPGARLTMLADREAVVEGRGYFAIAPDTAHPFHIRSSAGEVVVVGTQFDLQVNPGSLEVLVVKGIVNLSGSGKSVRVTASERGWIEAGTAPSGAPVDSVYVSRALTWLGNFLAFEETRLDDVAVALERHFGTSVVVSDSALAKETVTAVFEDETLAAAAEYICRAVSAKCIIQPDRVVIAP